jgi:hypothetical protein
VKETFEDYIKRNWPSSVPADCTQMTEDGHGNLDVDCMERGVSYLSMCKSCQVYTDLSMKYEREVEGIQPTRSR